MILTSYKIVMCLPGRYIYIANCCYHKLWITVCYKLGYLPDLLLSSARIMHLAISYAFTINIYIASLKKTKLIIK